MGQRVKPKTADIAYEDVVKIIENHQPEGPAENSFIMVSVFQNGERQARYLSWIGYADLDFAKADEPDAWELVEPAAPYTADVVWKPYG